MGVQRSLNKSHWKRYELLKRPKELNMKEKNIATLRDLWVKLLLSGEMDGQRTRI